MAATTTSGAGGSRWPDLLVTGADPSPFGVDPSFPCASSPLLVPAVMWLLAHRRRLGGAVGGCRPRAAGDLSSSPRGRVTGPRGARPGCEAVCDGGSVVRSGRAYPSFLLTAGLSLLPAIKAANASGCRRHIQGPTFTGRLTTLPLTRSGCHRHIQGRAFQGRVTTLPPQVAASSPLAPSDSFMADARRGSHTSGAMVVVEDG
uniref:Uncharacterized protein n=1 Tax=Setaria italica TaxID=4555 RepID=K3YVT1_SETIT